VANDQAAAHFFQRHAQFTNTLPYELDATVLLVGQGIENFTVEHKYTMHTSGGFERVMETRIVGRAQIAAEPEKSGIQQGVSHWSSER